MSKDKKLSTKKDNDNQKVGYHSKQILEICPYILFPMPFMNKHIEEFNAVELKYLFYLFQNSLSKNKLECFISNKILKRYIASDSKIKKARNKFVKLGLVELRKVTGGWIHKIVIPTIKEETITAKIEEYIEEIKELYEGKNLEDAIEKCYEAIELCDTIGSYNEKLEIYQIISKIRYEQNDFEAAIKEYNMTLRLARDIADKDIECDSLLILGDIHFDRKEYNKAFSFYQQAFQIASESKDYNKLSEILCKIATIHEIKGEIANVLRCYQQSLDFAKSSNDEEALFQAYLNLGQFQNVYIGNYKEALVNLNNALDFTKKKPYDDYKSKVLFNISKVYHNEKDFEKAKENLDESIEAADKNDEELFKIHLLSGKINFDSGDYDEAKKNFKIASKSIKDKESNEYLEIRIFEGAIEAIQGDLNKGLSAVKDAISLAEEKNIVLTANIGKQLIGKILIEKGKEEEGLLWYDKALSEARKSHLIKEIQNISLEMGKIPITVTTL